MNAQAKPPADNGMVINEDGTEVLDPAKALSETSLAVAISTAELDQEIATAHKYPRKLHAILEQLETMACYSEEAAENCVYALPRAGKAIVGPSIGFANLLASVWGNCRDAGTPTHVDMKDKVIFAEGVFHDLQSNRKVFIRERRSISGKGGRVFSTDMINVTGKAASSIARRNAILAGVPRAMWHPIYLKALNIVQGDAETFADRKDKAMKAFHRFGVKPEQVYMALGLKGDADLTLEHIPTLRGMFTALKDGETTVEELFDPRRYGATQEFARVANPLGDHPDEPTTEAAGVASGAEGETDGTAGMGDDEPAQHHQQVQSGAAVSDTVATAAGEPQQQVQGGAAPATSEAKPAAATSAPADAKAAHPAQAEAPAKAQGELLPGGKPTDGPSYLAHWEKLCREAASSEGVRNAFAKERDLRKACALTADILEQVTSLRDQRVEELTSK